MYFELMFTNAFMVLIESSSFPFNATGTPLNFNQNS